MNIRESATHPIDVLEKQLETDLARGISEDSAEARLEANGKNTFSKNSEHSFFGSILDQVTNPLNYILIAAGVITIILHEYLDAIVIALTLLLNITIGLIQEGRASRAFEKLSNAQEKHARVLRGGAVHIIDAGLLVPGDIIEIEAGMTVPADVRITSAQSLEVNEASLTGESKSVSKHQGTLDAEPEITECSNCAFMGTLVDAGQGKGIVIATGDNTQIGKLAGSLTEIREEKTPIEDSVSALAKLIARAAFALVVFLMLLGLAQGREVGETLLIAIVVAVSILPEGLPASVTVVLALGMERILGKGGLVKNLLAAETLGSTTVIMTDKTGTLTEMNMRITDIFTADDVLHEGAAHISEGHKETLSAAVQASDAFFESKNGELVPSGKPIEKAILEKGLEMGVAEKRAALWDSRIDFLPFESENRFAAAISRDEDATVLYASGAPETILAHATHVLVEGEPQPLDNTMREELLSFQAMESEKGSRCIAASKKIATNETLERNDVEKNIEGVVFLGFIALNDPVRKDVPEAITTAQNAGARVIMVTGDHPGTATSVARAVGIGEEDEAAMTGKELAELDDEKLRKILENRSIFARVLPETKLRIAKILQREGEIVAMTGDGVNDAPALRRAHIGMAVESGTEVAKAAADMILLKNSFTIIVDAIREGRRIIDNLKKIVAYLLSTNLSELIAIVGTIALAMPVPLLPTQILWVNIVSEGFLNFALAFEKAEPGAMKQDPRTHSARSILGADIIHLILIVGMTAGITLGGLYIFLTRAGVSIEMIRTAIFIALSLGTTLYAFSFKALTRSIVNTNLFSNMFLLGCLALNIGILALSLTLAPLRHLLSLEVPTAEILAYGIGVSVLNIIIIEIAKLAVFRKKHGVVS